MYADTGGLTLVFVFMLQSAHNVLVQSVLLCRSVVCLDVIMRCCVAVSGVHTHCSIQKKGGLKKEKLKLLLNMHLGAYWALCSCSSKHMLRFMETALIVL